ncbi:MAG: hypothetical protein KDI06_08290, partial [Calditrichaeota bacterium]|nr:hypothetical protein [Calditrichota bacterium]
MRQGRFEGVVNKTLTDDRGNQYIQVKHQNRFFKVNIAQTEDEFREVLGFDNRFFRGKQAITLQVLQLISQFGKVVFYRAPENGEIQGVSQILYQSIPQQEVRMGEAFLYGTAGIGHGQVLFKAQEVLAREANKALIRGTVRVENTQTIRALFKAGYRIMAFDPSRYAALEEGGGRLVMEKDLIHEQ